MRSELARFIVDVSRWVDNDVKDVVMDATVESLLCETDYKKEAR